MPQPGAARHRLTLEGPPHRFWPGFGRGIRSTGLSLKTPKSLAHAVHCAVARRVAPLRTSGSKPLRKLTFAAGFTCALLAYGLPAQAQGISLLRDTETEEALRRYKAPLARAPGLDPVPTV